MFINLCIKWSCKCRCCNVIAECTVKRSAFRYRVQIDCVFFMCVLICDMLVFFITSSQQHRFRNWLTPRLSDYELSDYELSDYELSDYELSDSEPFWFQSFRTYLILNLSDSKTIRFRNYLISNPSDSESIWCWTYLIWTYFKKVSQAVPIITYIPPAVSMNLICSFRKLLRHEKEYV
jgi:hypothetical protein